MCSRILQRRVKATRRKNLNAASGGHEEEQEDAEMDEAEKGFSFPKRECF